MWYVMVGAERKGPFTEEQIKKYIARGQVTEETMAWTESFGDEWIPLSKIPLFIADLPQLPKTELGDIAKEATQKAYEQAKIATGHAFTAIKMLIVDPMGGQGEAWKLLGPEKGLLAGLACLALVIALPLSYVYVSWGLGTASLVEQIKFIGFLILIPGILAGCTYFLAFIVTKNKDVRSSIFTTGIASLPFSCLLILTWLIGFGNVEVLILAAVCFVVFFLQLLNAGLVQVHAIPTKIAFYVTPVLLIGFLYVLKIFLFRGGVAQLFSGAAFMLMGFDDQDFL